MIQEELFDHMREWNTFIRRHDANIFDVMFKDVDYSLKYHWHNIGSAMAGFPAFVYGRQKLLNEELAQCVRDIREKKM